MQHYDLIIFDADGTLRECTIPDQPCPNQPDEWRLIPGVIERLQEIDWTNIRLGVASNQAGVSFGFLTQQQARKLIDDMLDELFDAIPTLRHAIMQVCHHAPDAGCDCRKPAPGMLLEMMEQLELSPEKTLYVGDMESDRQAAENAGVDFQWAQEFFGGK